MLYNVVLTCVFVLNVPNMMPEQTAGFPYETLVQRLRQMEGEKKNYA